jgi:hypothetical protein
VGRWEKQPIEQNGGVTYSNQLDMGLKDGHVIMPPGLMNTSGIDGLLRSYVARSRNVELRPAAIPTARSRPTWFRARWWCSATATCDRHARQHGVPRPAPVRLGDYILNDGGMVRNLYRRHPQACADVIIAVNLVTEPVKPEEPQTATRPGGEHVGDIGTPTSPGCRTPSRSAKAARAVAFNWPARRTGTEFMAWRERVRKGQPSELAWPTSVQRLEWINPAYLATLTGVRTGDVGPSTSEEAEHVRALDIESVSYNLTGDPATRRCNGCRRRRAGAELPQAPLTLRIREATRFRLLLSRSAAG